MIPKVIHYCWFGGGPMSVLHQRCIESWRLHCPDYELRLWNEDNADISNAYCREAVRQGKWAFVSDWVRFDALYRHGGIYLDTDMELIAPLDALLDMPGCVAARESRRSIGAALIACHAGDPLMARSRSVIVDELIGRTIFVSSPLILRRALQLEGAHSATLLDQATFYPFNPYERTNPRNAGQFMFSDLSEQTIGIHHYGVGISWGNGRLKRGWMRLLKKLAIRPRWDISFDPFEPPAA